MPYALCPMPYALCPLIKRAPHVTETISNNKINLSNKDTCCALMSSSTCSFLARYACEVMNRWNQESHARLIPHYTVSV
jgi:hypothetical protein